MADPGWQTDVTLSGDGVGAVAGGAYDDQPGQRLDVYPQARLPAQVPYR